MPGWYYDKKELRNTPSAADGIDYKTEMRYRKKGARFIIDTGMEMDLGYNTTATGVVYFHRFYMFHSFKQFPRYVTACCCLFLAGKVEETPKKCKDIIRIAKTNLDDLKFATFGDDPKEEVMILERILLQTIKFDLQVEHPYQYLLKYAKCLKGDKAKLEKMVQMAWTFVNDSLCTTLCLQWEPEIIAVALMYLAGKLSKFEVVDWVGRTPKHLRWWDMFVEDVTMDLLEDICHQVLDLYSQPATKSPSQSPPPPGQRSARPPSPTTPQNNRNGNGNDKQAMSPETPSIPPINTKIPPPSDIPQFPYQTFTNVPPPLASYVSAPPHLAGPPPPPPHLAGPPPNVFPSFVSHPPPFPPVVPPNAPPPPFYPNGPPPPAQPHNSRRPYFPHPPT
ncbi:cyclin-K [Sitophilus oryzae]|uniref:Cyclin-K n=1 Tax=Sitophilus oryzae TaxID=7048 RepID=A0A6J2YG97_SITOR|nr:cyclin-K [Sitophilus oryzae]